MCSDAASGLIVTGASGLLGPWLLPLLVERGVPVQATSRRRRPVAGPPSPVWAVLDLAAAPSPSALAALQPATALVHAAPLWLLPAWLPAFAERGVRRVVAFGSTSRFTKRDSASAKERALAARLAEAEEALARRAGELALRWTLLRPSLIYGGGRDRNVSDVGRFLARWGFFPVCGEAGGRRQPVHAADLATAALAVLDNPSTFGRAYDLPGGETLSYAEMVARVARGLGRRPRLLHLPPSLLRAAALGLRLLPGYSHVTAGMVDRMDEDLVFDDSAARRDFGWRPRRFGFPDGEPPFPPGAIG